MSGDTIDHKARAADLIRDSVTRAFRADGTNPVASVKAAQAQVHATLYAAEQQRIANLIAFLSAESGPYKVVNHMDGAWAKVVDQIADGLGLA